MKILMKNVPSKFFSFMEYKFILERKQCLFKYFAYNLIFETIFYCSIINIYRKCRNIFSSKPHSISSEDRSAEKCPVQSCFWLQMVWNLSKSAHPELFRPKHLNHWIFFSIAVSEIRLKVWPHKQWKLWL